VGGHAAGEVASHIAVRTVHDEIQARETSSSTDYNDRRTGADKVTPEGRRGPAEHAVQRARSKIHEEAAADAAKRAWARP